MHVLLMTFVNNRNNLKELDDITIRLNQRLCVSQDQEEHHQDSEGPMPLSTSSALITCGSTSFDGTWGFHSTLRSDRNGALNDALQMPDALASTVGSAATTDAVAEMMRCTLECTGSSSGRDQPWNLKVQHCDNGSSGGESDVIERRDMPSSKDQNPCDELQKPSATDMGHYADSLKHAQELLQKLNIINSGYAPVKDELTGRPPNGRKILNNHEHTDTVYGDDDVVDMQEDDDTFANIWAMRQSRARNNSSNSEGSFNSNVEQGGGETSYMSPRTLNDLPQANDNSRSVANETDGGEKSIVDSGDTWFVDVQDARSSKGSSNTNNNNSGNCSNTQETERQQRINNADVDIVDVMSNVLHEDGHSSPGSIRSPSGIQSHASDGGDDDNHQFLQQKVKPPRRSAMHRRETRRQPLTSSSSASDDEYLETVAAASVKGVELRHSQPCGNDSAKVISSRLPRSLPVTSLGRHIQTPVSNARDEDDVLAAGTTDAPLGAHFHVVDNARENNSSACDSKGQCRPVDRILQPSLTQPVNSMQYPF
jgi:hypothetical protein